MNLPTRLVLLCLASIAVSAIPAMADWEPVGPTGGTVLALEVDPFRPETVYAGVLHAGLFKSVDAGTTWQPSGQGLPPGSVSHLVLDPQRSGTLYAVTETDGIYRSVDAGATWRAANAGMCCDLQPLVMSFAIDPRSPSTLYVSRVTRAGETRLFKTVNGGRSWFSIGQSLGRRQVQVVPLAVDPDSQVVWAGTATGRGLFRSADGGLTWMWAAPSPVPGFTITRIAVQPGTGTIFAEVETSGLYVSFNGGKRWRLAAGLPSPLVADLEFTRSGPIYAATLGGVARSRDGGLTWVPLDQGLDGAGALAVESDPRSPSTLYAGTHSGGVFKSDDSGRHWTASNAGLRALVNLAVAADPGRPDRLVVATDLGVLRSEDGGASWALLQRHPYSFRSDVAIDPARPETVFTTTYREMWRTRSDGASWRRIGQELSEILGPLALDRRSGPPVLYAAIAEGVSRSLDEGRTWLTVPLDHCSIPLALALAGGPGRIYAGAFYNFGCGGNPGGGVFRSDDGGLHWTSLGLTFEDVQALAVSPDDPDTIYAGALNGLAHSADGGATWEITPLGAPGEIIVSLAVEPGSPSTVYAGLLPGGVYRSTDGGATWTSLNEGVLDGAGVFEVLFDNAGQLYAATTRGLFRRIP